MKKGEAPQESEMVGQTNISPKQLPHEGEVSKPATKSKRGKAAPVSPDDLVAIENERRLVADAFTKTLERVLLGKPTEANEGNEAEERTIDV